MPASQTVDYTNKGYLKISIEPNEHPDSVYFTDQSPSFDIVIENTADRAVRSPENRSSLKWALSLGDGKRQISTGKVDFSIEPGETYRERIEPGLLAYEDNAVLGVATATLNDSQETDAPISIYASKSDEINKVLYTFPIWDRSHYNAIHEQPKRMTKWVIFFGGLTALLAAIQVGILIGQLA